VDTYFAISALIFAASPAQHAVLDADFCHICRKYRGLSVILCVNWPCTLVGVPSTGAKTGEPIVMPFGISSGLVMCGLNE